jgi:hypothetical protein
MADLCVQCSQGVRPGRQRGGERVAPARRMRRCRLRPVSGSGVVAPVVGLLVRSAPFENAGQRGRQGMADVGASSAKHAPYFFLSHSRLDGDRHTRKRHSKALLKVYRDLSHLIHEIAEEASPGYLDIAQPLGEHWPSTLEAALGTCRVLVPLYSRDYFRSPWCGKEWSAFALREGPQYERSNYIPAIVPILWHKVASGNMPPCLAEIRYMGADLDTAYADHGIFGLRRVSRAKYDSVLYKLASEIHRVANVTRLAPLGLPQVRSLPNAFGTDP